MSGNVPLMRRLTGGYATTGSTSFRKRPRRKGLSS
jgi:hypothetical protein